MAKIIYPSKIKKIEEANLETAKSKLFKSFTKGYKKKDIDEFVETVLKNKNFELFIDGQKIKTIEKKPKLDKRPNENTAENLEPSPKPAEDLPANNPL